VIGAAASQINNQNNSQQLQVIQSAIQNSSLIQSPSQPPPTILNPRNLYIDNTNQFKYFTGAQASSITPSNIPYQYHSFAAAHNFSQDGGPIQDDNHSHAGREDHHQSTSNLVPDSAVLQCDTDGVNSKVFLFEFLSLAIMVVAIPLFLVLVFIIYIL